MWLCVMIFKFISNLVKIGQIVLHLENLMALVETKNHET